MQIVPEPLTRERLEDIPVLVNALITKVTGETGLKPIKIPPPYMERPPPNVPGGTR